MATLETIVDNSVVQNTRRSTFSNKAQDELRFIKAGLPVASHLGFQMSLYFNVWYYPFWTAICIYALYEKYSILDDILAALCPIFIALSIFLEGCRLYFGYYGNLFENIAALGAYFLITIFLQVPIIVVQVASYRFRMLCVEWWMDIVLLGFVFLEVITGTMAYRQISLVQNGKLFNWDTDDNNKKLA
ncbi:transmembrane protein 17B-like [Paramacrobiotus metropolitanus]|uniref:transmembrane protein 17B-like n=1 Tax=Paramacrobiotus metropolitanus TaxID=2943436 RepID=UPI0024460292|nr:transmembrane protein 17B-like [Paramacrobiotus metropolitanus]